MTSIVLDLPVDLLTIGEDVRLDEDPEAIAGLAFSVAHLGVLQPLTVRPAGDGWEVIAGRRRLTAARMAELATVPCIVVDLDDDRSFDATLAENLHRRDLSWIEVALAYARLRDRGLQQRQIAAQVGKSEAHVSKVLKLLTLPPEIRDRVHRREITYTTAIDLAKRASGPKKIGGGVSTKKLAMSGEDALIATHWRRRHDRLVAGIIKVFKANDVDVLTVREMLRQLLELDRQDAASDPKHAA